VTKFVDDVAIVQLVVDVSMLVDVASEVVNVKPLQKEDTGTVLQDDAVHVVVKPAYSM
jgi:hypothetical protein